MSSDPKTAPGMPLTERVEQCALAGSVSLLAVLLSGTDTRASACVCIGRGAGRPTVRPAHWHWQPRAPTCAVALSVSRNPVRTTIDSGTAACVRTSVSIPERGKGGKEQGDAR